MTDELIRTIVVSSLQPSLRLTRPENSVDLAMVLGQYDAIFHSVGKTQYCPDCGF